MPGAGRSSSGTARAVGAIVAVIAVVGSLALGWSFDGAGDILPTAIGVGVAVLAVGWTLYSRVVAP